MTDEHDYESIHHDQWCESLAVDALEDLLRSAGCTRVLIKELVPNNNSKNQIYLAPGLGDLAAIPSGIVESRPGKSNKKTGGGPIFSAPLNFSWLRPGGLSPAPHAQLIFYPQYPEVRLGSLLKGSYLAPNHLLDPQRHGCSPGRVLLLGVPDSGDSVVGLLLPPTAPVIATLLDKPWAPHGPLRIWELSPSDAADSRTSLLRELCRVSSSGWIASKRLKNGLVVPYSAQNGGGFTLEAELGIAPNGHSRPDYLGWEVKQHGVRNFQKPSAGQITLFTPEPDGGIYRSSGVEGFVRRWGYDKRGDGSRLDFSGTHRGTQSHKTTGLRLALDGYNRSTGRLTDEGCIALVDSSGESAASWSFAKLMTHWKRKHSAAVFVSSECRTVSVGRPPEYRYSGAVSLGVGTDIRLLLDAIHDGLVVYDPGIHIDLQSDGSWKAKTRNQFRISSKSLSALYEEFETVSACEKPS